MLIDLTFTALEVILIGLLLTCYIVAREVKIHYLTGANKHLVAKYHNLMYEHSNLRVNYAKHSKD